MAIPFPVFCHFPAHQQLPPVVDIAAVQAPSKALVMRQELLGALVAHVVSYPERLGLDGFRLGGRGNAPVVFARLAKIIPLGYIYIIILI